MRSFFFAVLVISCFNVNEDIVNAQQLQLQWAQNTVGMPDSVDLNQHLEDRIWGLSIDSQRNIVLAGHFGAKIFSIGDTALVNAGPYSLFSAGQTFLVGSEDAFIAKLSANGDVLWAQRAGGTHSDDASAIAIDPIDNIVVVGSFSDTAAFGNLTLIGIENGSNEYIAKFSQGGTLLWIKQLSTPMVDGLDIEAVATTSSGEIVVAGDFNGTVDFGGSTLTATGLFGDYFLGKYSPDGDLIWLRHGASSDEARTEVVAIDDLDNIWGAGCFRGTLDFGDTTLASAGDDDFFLIKYDKAGNLLMSRREGGIVGEEEAHISLDSSGNVFLAGQWEGDTTNIAGMLLFSAGDEDIFIAKYNSAGEFQWVRQAGGEDLDDRPKVATDMFGNVFVTGRAEGTPAFGDTVLPEIEEEDGFLAVYDPTGTLIWVQREPDDGEHIAIDHTNSIILSGAFSDTLIYGNNTLASPGRTSIFIVKYGSTITRVEERENIPTSFTLRQNYPNPFNPATTISYILDKPVVVELTIYNLLGQKITTLVNKKQAIGKHDVRWDGIDKLGRRVSSGVYVYRLQAGQFVQARKMLFLK